MSNNGSPGFAQIHDRSEAGKGAHLQLACGRRKPATRAGNSPKIPQKRLRPARGWPKLLIVWRPQGDSNPRYRRERAVFVPAQHRRTCGGPIDAGSATEPKLERQARRLASLWGRAGQFRGMRYAWRGTNI